MKVKVKYPMLHKTLSRHFGARKAKKLITNLHNQDMAGNLAMNFEDSQKLSSSVVFSETAEGYAYWVEFQKQIEPNWS